MTAYFICLVVLMITYLIYRYRFKSRARCIIHEGICTKIAVTAKQCTDLIHELESSKPQIVGLDIEWSSQTDTNQYNKVSLLQIGHKNMIILIRLNLMQRIPGKLHDFLGNVSILKAGIGIYDDRNKLYNDYKLNVYGCVDINHIFNNKLSITKQNTLKSIYYNKDINDLTKEEMNNTLGLNSMSLVLLKQNMKYKAIHYTFHNQWNDNKLSMNHIHYAADDALIGYKLLIKLMQMIKDHQNESYLTLCYGLIDIKNSNKMKRNKNKSRSKLKNKSKNKQNVLINGYIKEIAQVSSYHVIEKHVLDVISLITRFYPSKQDLLNNNAAASQVLECGVCGIKNKLFNLPKYHIFPNKYLKYINMDKEDKKDHFIPENNVILTCKSCKKICDLNSDKFRSFLCEKYNISCAQTRRMFIKVRTAANGLIDANIRYKLPIKYQIKALKNMCCFFNLRYDIVYNNDDIKDDDMNEYKWQWYDNTMKSFVDYDDDLSFKIENEYIANKDIMHFEIFTNKYVVDFSSMEQQNIKSKYKRGMRRIYTKDSMYLMKYGLSEFDHLIKINCDNGYCIGVTTNDIILCCIDDVMKNGQKSVSSLQKEQFEIHTKQILDIIQDPKEFSKLWKRNFIDTIKPKHYNDS